MIQYCKDQQTLSGTPVVPKKLSLWTDCKADLKIHMEIQSGHLTKEEQVRRIAFPEIKACQNDVLIKMVGVGKVIQTKRTELKV